MNQEVIKTEEEVVAELLEKKSKITAMKSKREYAEEFIHLTDNYEKKFNFKTYLNKILEKNRNRVAFIKKLYSLKLQYKSFKHLNLNTKRIVLNNVLRETILNYSSNTGFAANDILVLLNNSNSIDEYFRDLILVFKKLEDRNISLI